MPTQGRHYWSDDGCEYMLKFRFIRYYWLRFSRLKGDPHFIALGVAFGVFVGLTPTVPLHTFLVLALCLQFKASKVAGIIFSVIVTNPFQYYAAWWIGSKIFPGVLDWHRVQEVKETLLNGENFFAPCYAIADLGLDAIVVLVTGGCLFALPFSLLGYYFAQRYFTKINTEKLLKSK